MSTSQALVPYTRSTSSALTAQSPSRSLRLFTASTGTAIATELLYRLLIDIINRLLSSLNRYASARLDQFSSYVERKWHELAEQRRAVPSAAKKEPRIVDEVSRLVEKRGFGGASMACPISGRGGLGGEMDIRRHEAFAPGQRPPGPPMWVKGVLEGIEEGRMQERDFWIHTHGD